MAESELERRLKRIESRLWGFVAALVGLFLATITLIVRFGIHLLVR